MAIAAGTAEVTTGGVASRFVEMALSTLGYRSLFRSPRAHPRVQHIQPQTFSADDQFWRAMLAERYHEGDQIRLRRFHLTEWVPASPGLFHTEDARYARRRAESHLTYRATGAEYLPMGKAEMLDGGIGCYRLAALDMGPSLGRPSLLHILGATSTGVCHAGVPVALPPMYREIIYSLHASGGVVVDLVGTIRILPRVFLTPHQLYYAPYIPRYFVLVDDLELHRSSDADQLSATTAIAFSVAKDYEDYWYDRKRSATPGASQLAQPSMREIGWSFSTFNPGPGPMPLTGAVDWLKSYALRYSGLREPRIVADFDATYDHFSNAVDLRLRSILDQGLSPPILQRVSYHLKAEKVQIGDTFSDISDSVIINRALLSNESLGEDRSPWRAPPVTGGGDPRAG